LIRAGFQVPVTPLVEVVASTGAVLPEHSVSVFPKLKTGVRIGFTVTVNVVVTIHWPGATTGVNVYTPEV
jgi:hypothetical protein